MEFQRHRGPGLRGSGVPSRGEGRDGGVLSGLVSSRGRRRRGACERAGRRPFDADAPAEGMRMQGGECGRGEDKRTSRTGEKLVWLDCGSGAVLSGRFMGLAYSCASCLSPGLFSAVDMVWAGVGQRQRRQGRTPKPCCVQREKLTADLGARRRQTELRCCHESRRGLCLALRGHR